MVAPILLDTHALLWWLAASSRMSSTALELINDSPSIAVSPISFWEVSMLQSKGRLQLNKPIVTWMHDVLRLPRVETAELKSSIAIEGGQLTDFHGDLADRLIYATAAAERRTLVTKDDKITAYAATHLGVVTAW
jgi:PIN domain nuclease of toxin-antitoxin system